MSGREDTSRQRRTVIDAIADELAGLELGHPVRVAVDGITAVGKTTFASELTDALRGRGRECTRVSMDGFHHPRSTRYRRGRESSDAYYEDAYDFDALRRELLDPLGPSGTRRYRTAIIDLATDAATGPTSQVADDRLVVVVDGSFLQRRELSGAWDRTVFLRGGFDAVRVRGVARDAPLLGSSVEAERIYRVRYHAAQLRYLAQERPERRADMVIEHTDPRAPVIRSHRVVRPAVPSPQLDETRGFFGPRAAAWNERFAADQDAFARAVGETGLAPGDVALDVGCGAGRALAGLGAAVGPEGAVVGVDLTAEMLAVAARRPLGSRIPLALADAARLPIAGAAVHAVFAAGLLPHLANPALGLVELARVTRAGGRLALFHPVGRATLAGKHGHPLRPDDPLDPTSLPALLAATGWLVTSIDDSPDRYLALAARSL